MVTITIDDGSNTMFPLTVLLSYALDQDHAGYPALSCLSRDVGDDAMRDNIKAFLMLYKQVREQFASY